jgi:hypothetical protein
MKITINSSILLLVIYILLFIGEIKCIYKACTCNWEPVGKAEILYTVGSLTGLGSIIGWIDIEDN